ncbi:uncharacterized protein LOC110028865 [Phalaenopsis equestris]|uniref:uncharacterized protein LOC110028865 n=1 Tax=Phalaenopsis equestris TaxID=78828 RepID=UPI0009E3A6F2|nr:uncharacterized protein LOC110028865 [Phalaenopsis equestris]
MSLVTEELRAKAQIYHGDSLGQEKCQFLLKEVGLPNGLLPLKDIIECGHIEETGFVWLKQRKKIEHTFRKIGRLVSYAPEITAYVEQHRIKKLTGVKAKELFIWLTLTDISADGAEEENYSAGKGKITFHSSSGLYRTFPASAFVIEEDEQKKKSEAEKKGDNEGKKEAEEVENEEKA